MSHLDPERLSLIALGDPTTGDERAHLDTCDECAIDLAELEYTVAVGRSTMPLGRLETPHERVWSRIADELELGRAEADATPPAASQSDAPVSTSPESTRPPRRRRMRILFALAASLVVVAGVLGTWAVVSLNRPVEVAAATLDAFPAHPGASGAAQVVETRDGRRVVEVELSDAEAASGYREVWLITADASALVSLGVLDGSSGQFTVPSDIDLADYVLVDISQEDDDGDPGHSGDSIVRGELGFVQDL